MATISMAEWARYRDILAKLNQAAADEFRDAVFKADGLFGGVGLGNIPREDLIDFAYALVTKYGEGATAAACEFYDALARAQNANVPPAEPAQTATIEEVGKTVNGVLKQSENEEVLSGAVGRLVKQAGQDTTLQNALRDGAEFAWIPSGDTCAFCITLASRGWQYASKDAIKGGHAEHIHSHCDCAYCIRFDSSLNVQGYDPKKYERMYYDADGFAPEDKINSMRREFYAENKEAINAQKRDAYQKRKELNSSKAEEADIN